MLQALAIAAPVLQSELLVAQPTMAGFDVLCELRADAETRAAALLWPVVDSGKLTLAQVSGFGAGVQQLLQGHLEARKVWPVYEGRPPGSNAEGVRRLLLVLIKDVRVVLMLLAEQLVRLRGASRDDPAERRKAAQVAADIHAPLANRLGVWQLKWELEDLSFRYLQPDTFKRIAKLLDERRGDRERFIKLVLATLNSALGKSGIDADIAGRPKHIYSIWKKMQRKGVEFSDVYDVRAVRLLVKDVPTCYAALGVVHSLWPYIPGEFDDYIANPKGNHYRSLHTAVIGPEGKTVEIQIRTSEMHDHAELGVAAHWRYKEGGASSNAEFERKISWMRQLLEHRDESGDDAGLLAGFSTELLDDHVYLLTPKGQVMELPSGATVLDFAYLVHTEVGHRCRGAKVNGRIVPLTHAPRSGDRIEVLTGKEIKPNRNWLDPQQGYLKSARSRSKLRGWFNQLDHAQNVREGRELLDRELKRLGLGDADLNALVERFGVQNSDELYIAVALGDIAPGQVTRAAHEAQAPAPSVSPVAVTSVKKQTGKPDKDAVVIAGVGNLLVNIANCCKPVPGDAITGFITRGRGVSVHRNDCSSLKHSTQREPARAVDVQWGQGRNAQYAVRVRVSAFDRTGLLRDVGAVFAAAHVNVVGSSTQTDPLDGTAQMDYALEVHDFGQLSQILAKLRALPNVQDARRE